MAFRITAASALPRISPALGLEVMRLSGMMGRATRRSTVMKRGNVMLAITKEVMTRGWDQGKTFPPRFYFKVCQ